MYSTTDTITPMISFHKSVVVNGGIVAKSASLGNERCKFVVNENGIYIVVPSKFDDTGNLSEINYRRYDLGAMIEAIQELNRRTAWMETDMSLNESLKAIDNIEDTTTNTGAFYNDTTDLLPGLKQTISRGSHFMLINANNEAIRFYEITDTYKGILNVDPLLVSGSEYCRNISIIMDGNGDYSDKYISPQILNKTDNSFNILALDIVKDGEYPTLSDKYYTYTPIFDVNNEHKGYNVSLKEGVTINDIYMDGSKIIPPIPYFGTINDIAKLTITSFAGLFKDCTELNGTIDLSDWDFSRITDMSHMFEDCSKINAINFGNNSLDNTAARTINTDYIFEGASKLNTVMVYKDAPRPAFIGSDIPDTLNIDNDETITDIPEGDKEPVNYNGLVWNISDNPNEPDYKRFSYTANSSQSLLTFELIISYTRNSNTLTKNNP